MITGSGLTILVFGINIFFFVVYLQSSARHWAIYLVFAIVFLFYILFIGYLVRVCYIGNYEIVLLDNPAVSTEYFPISNK